MLYIISDYRSDSLSARMQLSANEKTMILTNLLSDLQTALPLMSERDTRVLPISRSDIQIGNYIDLAFLCYQVPFGIISCELTLWHFLFVFAYINHLQAIYCSSGTC